MSCVWSRSYVYVTVFLKMFQVYRDNIENPFHVVVIVTQLFFDENFVIIWSGSRSPKQFIQIRKLVHLFICIFFRHFVLFFLCWSRKGKDLFIDKTQRVSCRTLPCGNYQFSLSSFRLVSILYHCNLFNLHSCMILFSNFYLSCKKLIFN